MSRIEERTGKNSPIRFPDHQGDSGALTALLLMMMVALTAVLTGCSQSAAPEQLTQTHLGHSVFASSKLLNELKVAPRFEKGMAYADLRKLAINAGWKPVIDPQCKANVVGSDYEETCSADRSLESCLICDHLPEVSGCSGDGYCGMYFQKSTEKLHVVSYGMIEDWGVSGPKSRLTVDGWDISNH